MSSRSHAHPRHFASPGSSAAPVERRLKVGTFHLLLVVSAFVMALYLALFIGENNPHASVGSPLIFAVSFAVFLLVMALFWYNHHCLDLLIRWRYPIAVGILVACVALRLSGSSVAVWSGLVGGQARQGTLFGIPRSVRSDEWLVFTPFAASQARLGFPAANNVLRALPTDVTMVYGQPAWALATLFRPFLWGYLLLGFERGLSFFWVARLLALWLAVFELVKVMTSDDELSAFAATLTAFSPVVQWWFSVNGTAELFVFGSGLVLSLRAFLGARTTVRRWISAALLGWLLWCYAFILYPAWQIPFAYLFAALGVWVLIEHHRQVKAAPDALALGRRGAVISLVVCVAAWSVVAGVAIASSASTIASVMGTDYPGARNLTGGLPSTSYLGACCASLSSAIKADFYQPNVCEVVGYVSVFPLGIVLGAYAAVCHRDTLCRCLLVPTALVAWYVLIGLPAPLAQATLLSKVPGERCAIMLGFADILLLVRALSVLASVRPSAASARARMTAAVVGGLGYAALACALASFCAPDVEDAPQLLMTFLCLGALATVVLLPKQLFDARRVTRGACLLACTGVVLLSGLLVNPLQQGADALTSSDLATTVESIEREDPGATWAADDMGGSPFVGQALAAAGAPTINTVNTYPALERWSALDPTGANRSVYNRYAFIDIEMAPSTSFQLVQSDLFTVHVTPEDLVKLGVDYLCSGADDLSSWNTSDVTFEPVTTCGNFTIYHVSHTL